MSKQVVVISGGTATNSLVNLLHSLTQNITYILPISDNGGSTSEVLRVLGGPAIGDIRSRITRLIPDEGFKQLLSYRLSEDGVEAKLEWTSIVEGNHSIWRDIEIQCKEMIRSFLIHVHMELLKKSRNPSTQFNFELASIGNLLLTGIRLFVGSLDSAIELLLRISRINPDIQILPCLNTNYTYHISALLQNGDIITGQSQISHPHEVNANTNSKNQSETIISSTSVNYYESAYNHQALQSITNDNHEDIPYQHPDLLISQLRFSKTVNSPLKSPIERIFYINQYGEEIHPKANARTLQSLNDSNMIIYSIGSLMTSIIPVLILQGIGNSIKSSHGKKVLLLNGNHDRETFGMNALDFIKCVHKALHYSFGNEAPHIKYSDILTHLIYLKDSEINVDINEIEKLGITCVEIQKDDTLADDISLYDLNDLQQNLDKIQNE